MRTAFISYSRRDYYTAESLHSSLTELAPDVDTWIDVRNLQLGEDWAVRIDDAIRSADVFVLVQSHYSGRSPNVRAECDRATELSKPVLVVVTDGSGLPPNIRPAAVYDARRSFGRAAAELSGDITTGRHGASAARHVARVVRPPWLVLLVLCCLVLNIAYLGLALGACAGALFTPRRAPLTLPAPLDDLSLGYTGLAALGPACLCIAAMTVNMLNTWLLLSRQLNARAFVTEQLIAVVAVAYGVLIAVGIADSDARPPPAVQILAEFGIPLILAMIASTALAIRVVATSTTLLRYTAIGRSFAATRRKITGDVIDLDAELVLFLGEEGASEEVGRVLAPLAVRQRESARETFTLEYDDEDAEVADLIRRHGKALGIEEGPEGDWSVIIVSNLRPPAAIHATGQSPRARRIHILTTPTVVADEAVDVRRLQWLDFRDRKVAALHALLASLAGASRLIRRLPVPLEPARFQAPSTLDSLVAILLCLSGASLGAAIGFLLRSATSPVLVTLAVLALLAAILAGTLAVVLTGRTCTKARFDRDLALWCGLVVLGLLVAFTHSTILGVLGALVFLIVLGWVALLFSTLRGGWLLEKRAGSSPTGAVVPAEHVRDAVLWLFVALSAVVIVTVGGP